MVRITASLAAAVLAFTPAALGSPVSRAPKTPVFDDLVFHDKSPRLFSTASQAVSEFIVYNEDALKDASVNSTISHFPPKSALQKRWIIGEDDRQLWDDDDEVFPGAAVGRLTWETGAVCSGVLVGPRHLLTVKHCMPSEPVSGEFAPGFDQTAPYGTSSPWAIITVNVDPDTCGFKNDWAIIVLNERLGDEVGWFGVKLPEEEKLDKPIFSHQGYPGDRDGASRPYRQTGISIHANQSLACDSTSELFTDTDAAGGQSGGPIWEVDEEGNYEVWGVLSGGLKTNTWAANIYASGDVLLRTLQNVLAEFP